MFFSHIFLGQNWIVVISTVVALVCCCLIILSDEEKSLEKFGDNYKRYMEKVPRINLVLGIIRRAR
jgi:protein-S-isoprenylcysteine O-methyltransferase Ste14